MAVPTESSISPVIRAVSEERVRYSRGFLQFDGRSFISGGVEFWRPMLDQAGIHALPVVSVVPTIDIDAHPRVTTWQIARAVMGDDEIDIAVDSAACASMVSPALEGFPRPQSLIAQVLMRRLLFGLGFSLKRLGLPEPQFVRWESRAKSLCSSIGYLCKVQMGAVTIEGAVALSASLVDVVDEQGRGVLQRASGGVRSSGQYNIVPFSVAVSPAQMQEYLVVGKTITSPYSETVELVSRDGVDRIRGNLRTVEHTPGSVVFETKEALPRGRASVKPGLVTLQVCAGQVDLSDQDRAELGTSGCMIKGEQGDYGRQRQGRESEVSFDAQLCVHGEVVATGELSILAGRWQYQIHEVLA